jgi:hypothetical protein
MCMLHGEPVQTYTPCGEPLTVLRSQRMSTL